MRRMSYIVIGCHISCLGLCEVREYRIYRYRRSPESSTNYVDTREYTRSHAREIRSEYITICIGYRYDHTIELTPRDRQVKIGISIIRDCLNFVYSIFHNRKRLPDIDSIFQISIRCNILWSKFSFYDISTWGREIVITFDFFSLWDTQLHRRHRAEYS